MSTVAEIEDAMKRLPLKDKSRLLQALGRAVAEEQSHRDSATAPQPHSILDIPTVSVGSILRSDFQRSELFEEMLRERF